MVGATAPVQAGDTGAAEKILEVENLTIRYGRDPVLSDVSLSVRKHEIFGIIGPANAGKTSFLKALNRMDMFTPGMSVAGDVRFRGHEIRRLKNVYALRSRIGVVFPLPVGLPMTIYDNVALAPRLAGVRKRADLDIIVERRAASSSG
jgi:phosphate transport system ATP-binding protein